MIMLISLMLLRTSSLFAFSTFYTTIRFLGIVHVDDELKFLFVVLPML